MPQTTGKLPTRPFLPTPPQERRQVGETPKELAVAIQQLSDWSSRFHDAFANTIWDMLSRVIVFIVSNTGQAAFAAVDTTDVVAFEGRELDTGYQIALTPSWNTKVWYTSKAVTGFTINASDAPGWAGGTVDWSLFR